MTFTNGDNQGASNLIANPSGKIVEDASSGQFNVLQYGIPSSERLRVEGESEKYLRDYRYQQRKGQVTYTIEAAKDFRLKWEVPGDIIEETKGEIREDDGDTIEDDEGEEIEFDDLSMGDIFRAYPKSMSGELEVIGVSYDDGDRVLEYKVLGSGGVEPSTEEVKYIREKQNFTETHNASFWKIGHLLVYKFTDALFENYALPNGAVAVQNNNVVVVNTMHDNNDNNHIVLKECMSVYLGMDTLDGGESQPSIPSWSSEAQIKINQTKNNRIPDVKNDRVTVEGTTRMSDTVTKSNGPTPTAIPTASKVKVAQNMLLIDANKINKWKTPSSITSRYDAVTQINKTGGRLTFTGTSPTKINTVTVHTPVVMYARATDDKEHDQRINPPHRTGNADTDDHAFAVDRPFTVTLPTSGQHLQTYLAPGYGNKDYRKYTREKEVQFPFDVYSETKQAFYSKGTWIKVPVTQETASFFLPVWVKEDSYVARFRSIAINSPSLTPEEHQANLNMSYRTPNGTMSNHVAYDTVKIDVVGRIYDFRITDIQDFNYEKVFRTDTGMNRHTGNYYWAGNKTIDGGDRGNPAPYTLPVRHGSHPDGYKNMAVKSGYQFKFDMKTKGNMWKSNDAVRITPTFSFVNKDGSGKKDVDVYYHSDTNYFVKIGSEQDSEYRSVVLNEPLRNVEDKQLKDTSEYLYRHASSYGYQGLTSGKSKVAFQRAYDRDYSKGKVVSGPYS